MLKSKHHYRKIPRTPKPDFIPLPFKNQTPLKLSIRQMGIKGFLSQGSTFKVHLTWSDIKSTSHKVQHQMFIT